MVVSLDPVLRAKAVAARGFMPTDEGDALFEAAIEACAAVPGAPLLEIGSYCGKSSIWLGAARRAPAARCCSPSTTTGAPRRTSPGGSGTSPTWSTRRSA